MRRAAAAVLVAAVVSLAIGWSPAGAQSSGPPSTIAVGEVVTPSEFTDCDGVTTSKSGSVRLDRSGDTSSVVEVSYTFRGQPGTVTFAGAQTFALIEVDQAGDFALRPGVGYAIGSPSEAEVLVSAAVADCVATPVLTDIPTNHSQSIELDDQPVTLELNDGILDVAIVQGRLPNGLSLNPDGTWSGTADETGEFPITLCFADPIFVHQAQRRVDLMQDLLKPEFVGLMNGNEQQFVVMRGRRKACLQID